MRIQETKVYKFDELSEKAQKKVLENQAQFEGKNFDPDFVYETAATIADLFGLDIRQTRRTNKDGSKHWYTPTIYYSGFCFQGDGACFEGRYEYKKGALKAVKDYAGRDTEIHSIVEALQDAQRKNFYRIRCDMKHSGHYHHSGCMRVDCENSEDSYRAVIDEDDFIQAMRDFADWIYARLEAEYDYITSEEYALESIQANEYEFTEDGEMI